MIYYITRELNELFVNIKIMNQYILKEKIKKMIKKLRLIEILLRICIYKKRKIKNEEYIKIWISFFNLILKFFIELNYKFINSSK